MKLTSHQREKIERAVRSVIKDAKADRTTYELGFDASLALREELEKLEEEMKNNVMAYNHDVASTNYLVEELMICIEGYLED